MATRNNLTDKAIRAAVKRAEQSGEIEKLPDGDGLRLDIQPSGKGWWRWRYRFAGAARMLSLGVFPVVTLADARARRDEARVMLAAGTDPSARRKADKVRRAEDVRAQSLADAGLPGPGTFEYVARKWWGVVHTSKVSDGHAARTLVRLEKDVFPWLGRRLIGEIEAPELLNTLQRVLDRGAIETTHRIKDACGQVFRYGIATGQCTRNPAADLRDALPTVPARHLAAVTEPARAAELLRAMHEYAGHPITRAALRLSALLFLRPGELRQLEWAWVDLDEKIITLPSGLMKRRKDQKVTGAPHLVPLALQAITILRDDLQPLTGGGRYLFPSLQTEGRPMSENTVRSALRRLGYGNEEMSAHGFRAMARTMAAERLGIVPEVIEAQLAHEVPDSLGRAYNRTQYLAQRADLMEKWANYLDKLRNGADVVPLNRAA